ncbi:GntR family transcriptional regulator YhfZ [Citrobacter portucalensis]
MRRTFIKKEGVVLTTLARYLLGEKCGNRLKTIDELAAECHSSVGLTQAALKTLESSGAIRIERRGRNGSYLVEMDNRTLLKHVDINNVVCAMPLPYTRLYEGLASGLKAQFDGIPFYYAHMRGADIRVECLLNGVYDMAVVSRLAAESYLAQDGLRITLALGPHTYVGEHQLICRKGESADVKRVGLDNRSADQKIMTEACFGNRGVELIDMPYHESLQRIAKGDVDAVIWNVVAEAELAVLGLEATPLTNDPRFLQATEAVVLTRAEDYPMQQLLRAVVNKEALLAHQQRVANGEQEPSY